MSLDDDIAPTFTQREITALLSPFLDPRMVHAILNWMIDNVDNSNTIKSMNQEVENHIKSERLSDAEFKERESQLISSVEPFKRALNLYREDQLHRISNNAEKVSIAGLALWLNSSYPEDSDITFPFDVDRQLLLLAQLYYKQGEYSKCRRWLVYYINHVVHYINEGSSIKNKMSCYWGILACLIIGYIVPLSIESLDAPQAVIVDEVDTVALESETPKAAIICILKINETFTNDDTFGEKKENVLKRAWLIHWSLFVVFKYYFSLIHLKDKGSNIQDWPQLQEWLLDERNIAVVLFSAPHLLRYYAVYALLNWNRKDHFRIICNAIAQAKTKYNDTFTLLLGALSVEFDFEEAQKQISEIKQSCQSDYLLHILKDSIEENSRYMIFETYCRIHKSINLFMIAQKLNMSTEKAERWIVNLIRHAKLEAKIDSEKNRVEISTTPPSFYQQIIEKTQSLALRSNMILQHLYQPTEKGLSNKNNANSEYDDIDFDKDILHKKSQGTRLGGFIPDKKPRKLVEIRN